MTDSTTAQNTLHTKNNDPQPHKLTTTSKRFKYLELDIYPDVYETPDNNHQQHHSLSNENDELQLSSPLYDDVVQKSHLSVSDATRKFVKKTEFEDNNDDHDGHQFMKKRVNQFSFMPISSLDPCLQVSRAQAKFYIGQIQSDLELLGRMVQNLHPHQQDLLVNDNDDDDLSLKISNLKLQSETIQKQLNRSVTKKPVDKLALIDQMKSTQQQMSQTMNSFERTDNTKDSIHNKGIDKANVRNSFNQFAQCNLNNSKSVELEARINRLERVLGAHLLSSLSETRNNKSSGISNDVQSFNPLLRHGSVLHAIEYLDAQISLLTNPLPAIDKLEKLFKLLNELHSMNKNSHNSVDQSKDNAITTGKSLQQSDNNYKSLNQKLNDYDEQQQQRLHHLYEAAEQLLPIAHMIPTLVSRLHSLRVIHTQTSVFLESANMIQAEMQLQSLDVKELKEQVREIQANFKEDMAVVMKILSEKS